MAARLSPAAEIVLDDLLKPHRSKARKVSSMHDTHLKLAKLTQRSRVIFAIRVVGVIDERPIVNDVPGQKYSSLPFQKPDAARRVSWRVDDLKDAIAQIDDVSALKQPLGRGGAYTIIGGIPSARQPVEHFIRCILLGKRQRVLRVG